MAAAAIATSSLVVAPMVLAAYFWSASARYRSCNSALLGALFGGTLGSPLRRAAARNRRTEVDLSMIAERTPSPRLWPPQDGGLRRAQLGNFGERDQHGAAGCSSGSLAVNGQSTTVHLGRNNAVWTTLASNVHPEDSSDTRQTAALTNRRARSVDAAPPGGHRELPVWSGLIRSTLSPLLPRAPTKKHRPDRS